MNNLICKLIDIQVALKVPKSKYNELGKYKYRSNEDILEAAKPLLGKQRVLLLLSDELVHEGERYYIRSSAELSDGTDAIKVYGFAREEDIKKGMDQAQITGSVSSYARKYALNGLFLIDDAKDPDAQEPPEHRQQTHKQPQNQERPERTESQKRLAHAVAAYAEREEITPQEAATNVSMMMHVNRLDELGDEQISTAIDVIETKWGKNE